MKHVIGIFTGAMILLFTGCASVPMAPMEQDTKAKEFSPAPNKASLYIYRNESFGGAVPMSVMVNGKTLGQTAAQTYFHLNVIPGKYSVESHAENVSNLSLSVEAGKNYFVWQEVKWGMWYARSLLQQVDENTGRAGVTESKLIASSVSDNDWTPLDMPIATPAMLSRELKELNDLYQSGALTAEEYKVAKQQVLSNKPRTIIKSELRDREELPEPTSHYPHKLTGEEISAHFQRHNRLTFDRVPKSEFSINVRPKGYVERLCPGCMMDRGIGVINIKVPQGLVCFDWDLVSYPSSTCFELIQIEKNRYQLVDPVDDETYGYVVP